MIRGVIAEDNLCFRESLEQLIKSRGDIEIVFCSDTGEAILSYFQDQDADVAFLDIGLLDMSGLEVARCIRAQSPLCELIFITSHDQYVRDAVGLYAADYIAKPLDEKRLHETLDRIVLKSFGTDRTLEVSTERGIMYIPENEIFAIEALRKRVVIYWKKGITEANHSLREIQSRLGANFFRSSRSYLVNVKKVTGIKPYSRSCYELTFVNRISAYLAKEYYDEFRRHVKEAVNVEKRGRENGP